ncbi:hypothetical protein C1Y11_27015 [Pseudomonas sp. FW305-20]|nr:hypothetical protein C1Y11_27015 [Pseudomonas sp. FW305-20]PMU14139.1 hypothetical protein C1Y10_26210 [Pseudomonas sp. FW305-122]PMX56922.1 hypothetical protein C1Y13_26185 [Pseudomonas sp. FW305-33]PMX60728.1 hypothetical protein C1X12_26415 [Pseudomonas sp. FW305-60]
MGARLLAMTECQPTLLLTDTPLSRAGSLPHGFYVEPDIAVRRGFRRWLAQPRCRRAGRS